MTKPVRSSSLPWENVTFNPGVTLAGIVRTFEAIAVNDKVVFILPAWPSVTIEEKNNLLRAFTGSRLINVEAQVTYTLTGRAYDPKNLKKKES